MNIIIKLMGVPFYEMSIGQIHERKEMSDHALYVDKIPCRSMGFNETTLAR
jgi:hypothetical protein